MGASLSSPSPTTMTPLMGRRPSSRYMALMAAASHAASSPRPRRRAAAMAVASVTLTISRPSVRSSFAPSCPTGTSDPPWHLSGTLVLAPQWVSQLLDTDHLGRGLNMAVTLNGRKRLPDGSLGGLMGDHDHRRWRTGFLAKRAGQFGAAPALDDAFERYALLCHAARDGGKGAGAVIDREPDVVAAFVTSHLGLHVRPEIFRLCDKGRENVALGNVDEVADDRRRRRAGACARADQHERAHKVSVNADAVRHAVDRSDDRIFRHHGRMHTLLDAAVGARGDAEQLDAVAEIVGGFDVGRGNVLDPLDIDGVERRAHSEGERGQQRKFVRSVEAADVKGWIGLGIAAGLRLFQDLGEAAPFGHHQREDVIAGAIEDAVDAADGIALQALADGLDDRNAARNSALKIQRDTLLLGKRRERWSMMDKHRVIGGDHVFAGAERGLDRLLGGTLLAANQLDKGVDLWIAGELDRIGDETETGDVGIAVLAPVTRRHSDDFDGPARAFSEGASPLGEQSQDPASDRAKTGEPEFQRLSH